MKKKVFEILKKAIQTFDNLDKIELIATFGSITNKSLDFNDLDIISISSKKMHDEFIIYLQSKFIEKNFEPIVFETILKKPKKEKENQIFIHDLNYLDINDLLSKEWKSVINTMKLEMIVLWGDKRFPHKLPFSKIPKEELLNPLRNWSQRISSEESFEIFQEYLIKIIPKLLQDYNYLDLDNLKIIKRLLIQKISWDKKLEKTKKLLAKS